MKLKAWIGLFFVLSQFAGCSMYDPPEQEVRGVWITNIDSQVMFHADSIRSAMETLSDQGFNVVFPVVLNDGYTLYPSEVMVKYFGEAYKIDSAMAANRIDPLKQIVIEAHKHDMEVIPWFEFGFASSYNSDGGHILEKYPEWAAKDKDGQLLEKNNFEWMNGIHPEVQEFVIALIKEVIANYDVDGVQGDDRLPAMPAHGGYSSYTREIYQSETGNTIPDNPSDSAFMRWKADKLNAFQTKLYETVKEHGDHLIVSSSPSVYPWSYDNYLQDSPTWVSEGTVDLLIPQNYRWDISSYKTTLNEVLEVHNLPSNTDVTLASGIIIKAGAKYNGFDYVDEAVGFNREQGVNGEVYFFYEGLDEKNGQLGDSLANKWYTEQAGLPYREAGYKRQVMTVNVEEGEDIPLVSPLSGRFQIYAEKDVDIRIYSSDSGAELTLPGNNDKGLNQGWKNVAKVDVKKGQKLTLQLKEDGIELLFIEDKRVK